MMIKYQNHIEGIQPQQLEGFFVDWPDPPSPAKHYEMLSKCDHRIIAVDAESDKVIGFINAITDKVLSAYIPLLEVLPQYQGKGVGQELVRRMLDELKDFYMIDLCCDEKLKPYYEKMGMTSVQGMVKRNYSRQSGR